MVSVTKMVWEDLQFVTKEGACEIEIQISWTEVETGSAITWKCKLYFGAIIQ